MALTDKQAFIEMFAERLKHTASSKAVDLDPIVADNIAKKFVTSLILLKTNLSNDRSTHTAIKGELTWSKKRAEHIDRFAQDLAEIFKPVGGINPKDASAYWSGAGTFRKTRTPDRG